MTRGVAKTEDYKSVNSKGARGARPVRRVVHCDGIRGVLEKREGRWLVHNEQEVRLTEALGGSGRALARLRALAATLDAGLVDRAGLTWLNKRLGAIADAENMDRVWVTEELLPAVAFACSLLPSSNGSRWLAWALSARLDANLLRNHLPGPGWCTITAHPKLMPWGYDREARWLDSMPKTFWERLDARRECCPPKDAGYCLGAAAQPCLRTVRMASDPRTPPRALKKLAQSSDEVVLDLVASHPRTPARVLLGIAERRECAFLVRLRVPQNRSASPWLLSRLAKNSLWQVKGLAAANSDMPVSLLRQLSTDESKFVRQLVALNSSTAEAQLRSLAGDDESGVRSFVASSPSCPVDVLERLLVDRIGVVRAAVVRNPAVSLELVLPRANDRALGVRAAVASRSDMPGDVLRTLGTDEKARVRRAAGANQSTPADVLVQLAAAPEREVRWTVGSNPRAPVSTLSILAADIDNWVRSSVAENASAPAELLEALAADDNSWISGAIAGNASTPAGLLASLAAHDYELEGRVGELHLGEDVRFVAAANPPSQNSGAWDLSAPLANRFGHLTWPVTLEEWRTGFLTGWPRLVPLNIDDAKSAASKLGAAKALVAAFVTSRPTLLTSVPEADSAASMGWPSSRTWESLARCQAIWHTVEADDTVRALIASALVGDGAAIEYMAYTRDLDLPDPLDLLADPESFKELQRTDQQFAALEAVAAMVITDTKKHWRDGFKVCIAAAEAGAPDIAAAAATRLVEVKPSGASLPPGFEAFSEVLADAGLLDREARAA